MENVLGILTSMNLITRRKNKFCKLLANDLEDKYGKDTEEFIFLKKLFFDYINDFNRSINNVLIGDIE